MVRMLFTLPQDKVKIVALPDGKYDVTVLDNEELTELQSGEPEEMSVQMYQYDGNQFRTIYELTEEEILADMEKWLNYDSSDEPTLEEMQHGVKMLSSFQDQLEKAIREAVNE